MAIILNDNIRINAGKPVNAKYLSSGNTAYTSVAAVNAAISIPERHVGLTVLINTGSSNTEYWYYSGVADIDLIEKKYASEQVVGDFITGATNLGFFSGYTGVQNLDLSGSGFLVADRGLYFSEYQWYYVNSLGYIRIGAPAYDGVLRRGYVNAGRTKSWIWSDSSNQWVVAINDVATDVGEFANVSPHSGYVFTDEEWTGGTSVGNATASVTVVGSLNTGTTMVTVGSPIYNNKSDQELHLRTIINDTPEFLNIDVDDYYVRFSGVSSVISGTNVGTGVGQVFKQKTGTTLQFRTIEGTGDTAVFQVGDRILISATGSVSGTTQGLNVGSGADIFKSKTGTTLQFRRITGSGGTTVTQSGDSVIVSGGEYNLASPSVIPLGGICSGTVLTGKTAFQLFEELLVPELCGSITPPSLSIGLSTSGLYEVDCNISQTVTGNFSRGAINPQYCSLSAFRSGLPNAYSFTGSGMPSGFQSCSGLSASNSDASYDVVIGTQSWSVQARYDAGQPALGSKGTEYCAALVSGCTTAVSNSIIGVYPLYGTTSTITTLTKQALQNMSTANNIQLNLVTESGGNKQKFEVPCAWLSAPTNRPLVGVCQWNTVSSQWEYPGGTCTTSLTLWSPSSASKTIQGNPVGYCQYTYNGVDRSAVCIRLVF